MSEDLSSSPQKSEIVDTTLFKPSLYGGRFTRADYWGYTLYGVIFAAAVEYFLGGTLIGSIITLLYVILYALPITVKRCHDIGESGFMVLPFITPPFCILLFAFCLLGLGGVNSLDALSSLFLVTVVFATVFGLALTFKLGFEDSQKGTNQYGPSTKYPGPAENYEENKQVIEVKNNSSTNVTKEDVTKEDVTMSDVAKGVAQGYANWVWDNIKLYIIPFLGIDWFEHKKVIMGIIHIIICLVVAPCVGMAIDGALYAIIAPWVSGIALSLICNMYHND